MIRFSRTRKHDPVFHNVAFANVQSYYDKNIHMIHASPVDVVLSASIPELIRKLSSYEDRRKVMSSDASASVDALRAVVLITYTFVWYVVLQSLPKLQLQ